MVDRYAGIEDVSMVAIISGNVNERTADNMYRRGTGKLWRHISRPRRWKHDVLLAVAPHLREDDPRLGWARKGLLIHDLCAMSRGDEPRS